MKVTRAELIAHERARMPVTSENFHNDCDCPVCRTEAAKMSGPSPGFVWFDGYGLKLEDDFAFTLEHALEDSEAAQGMFGNRKLEPAFCAMDTCAK